MADQYLKDLTALSSLTTDDIFYVVDDPAGDANDRKLAVSVLDARYQLSDAQLDDIAALAVTDGNIIVGDGSNWVAESGATARTSLGVGTGDSPTFAGLISSGAAGIDCNPGSDTDTDLITVGVTGSPKLWWDESDDAFEFLGGDVTSRRAGATVYPRFELTAVTDGGNPIWNSRRAAGDAFGSEAAISAYDELGIFSFWGYSGSDYSQGGKFIISATENWSGSNRGTRYILQTAITGGTTLTEAIRCMDGEMRVGGGGNPSARLHVDQGSSTGATSVLLLDQADIDYEFIRFVGSSEDSQADRSLVDVADMTTPGALVGWFQIYVQDVQSTNPIADSVYYVPFYAAPSA